MQPMFFSYIRMFSGRPEEINSDTNFLTDAIELRSNNMASTLAVGISLSIASLTSFAAVIFLTPMITWTPRKARTRAVSVPIPLVAPVITMSTSSNQMQLRGTFWTLKACSTYHIKTKTQFKNYLSIIMANCQKSWQHAYSIKQDVNKKMNFII